MRTLTEVLRQEAVKTATLILYGRDTPNSVKQRWTTQLGQVAIIATGEWSGSSTYWNKSYEDMVIRDNESTLAKLAIAGGNRVCALRTACDDPRNNNRKGVTELFQNARTKIACSLGEQLLSALYER